MKLWLVSQRENTGYDTYNSMVVAAETSEEACRIDPSIFFEWSETHDSWMFIYSSGERKPEERDDWAHPSRLECKLLGEAAVDVKPGVISTDFHAG